MRFMIGEMVGPIARRVGGQAAAFMVAMGMAQQHEAAVAAAVAWIVITAAEVVVSSRSRKTLVMKARRAGKAEQ